MRPGSAGGEVRRVSRCPGLGGLSSWRTDRHSNAPLTGEGILREQEFTRWSLSQSLHSLRSGLTQKVYRLVTGRSRGQPQ